MGASFYVLIKNNPHWGLFFIFEKPFIGFGNPFFERGFVFPTEGVKAGNIEEFSRSAVGFGGVVYDFSVEFNDVLYKDGEVFDGNILSRSDIDDFISFVGIHEEYACVGKIVNVEEFPPR